MPTDSANGAELTVTLDVTNVSATDGAPEFTASATAAETTTGDVECDPSDADNKATVTDSEAVTVANVSAPVVALALAGEGGCLEEDSLLADNQVSLTVTPQGDDLLSEIVISGLHADWTYDFDGLDTDDAGTGVTVVVGANEETITFTPATNAAYNGTFQVQPPADSEVDHPKNGRAQGRTTVTN